MGKPLDGWCRDLKDRFLTVKAPACSPELPGTLGRSKDEDLTNKYIMGCNGM